MIQLSEKRRKKALLRNSANLSDIWDKYYALRMFENTVFERSYVVERHTYLVKDILKQYNIESVNELFFLLHKQTKDILGNCKFCDHTITRVMNRSGKENLDDCRCRGICTVCNQTYQCSNDDGVCYTCKPYYHPEPNLSDDPDHIRYRFLRCTGNHEYMENIHTVEEAERMMSVANYYHDIFLRIANGLASRDNSRGTSGEDVA